jgi:hypothetical protein
LVKIPPLPEGIRVSPSSTCPQAAKNGHVSTSVDDLQVDLLAAWRPSGLGIPQARWMVFVEGKSENMDHLGVALFYHHFRKSIYIYNYIYLFTNRYIYYIHDSS